jgi:branched-chain amino acid transport system substrate-binding protein
MPHKFLAPYLVVLCSCLWFTSAFSDDYESTVKIYIDADYTVARSSAVSIEQGLRTALSEVGNRLGGRKVEVVPKNHRGSSPRSKRHLGQYLQDDKALAVFSGLHSPPLLAHREFINQQGILVLDPWAAAGPITRFPAAENWIFRLSVDDTKAGRVIVDHAVKNQRFKRPYLLLEDTGWGKSNERTMGAALKASGIAPAGISWFKWDMSRPRARAILRLVNEAAADVILLVANATEAKTLIKEMVNLDMQVPICSHWGITGGDFVRTINASVRQRVPLSFIQTRFSFISHSQDLLGQKILQKAQALFPDQIETAQDIKAPAGFIHAYDLARIFIAAVEQVGLTGDIVADRRTVRAALENLDKPVQGLVKRYKKPFGVFGPERPDAHEALSQEDLVMARYGDNDEIILLTDMVIER